LNHNLNIICAAAAPLTQHAFCQGLLPCACCRQANTLNVPLPQDVLAHLLVTGSATCLTAAPQTYRVSHARFHAARNSTIHTAQCGGSRIQTLLTGCWIAAHRGSLSPKVRMTLCGLQPKAPAAAACLRLTHLHESYSPDRHSRGHAGCAAGHLTCCHNSHVQNRIALDHRYLYVSGRGVRACCLKHQRSMQSCRSMWQHVIHRKAVQAARRTQAPFCAPRTMPHTHTKSAAARLLGQAAERWDSTTRNPGGTTHTKRQAQSPSHPVNHPPTTTQTHQARHLAGRTIATPGKTTHSLGHKPPYGPKLPATHNEANLTQTARRTLPQASKPTAKGPGRARHPTMERTHHAKKPPCKPPTSQHPDQTLPVTRQGRHPAKQPSLQPAGRARRSAQPPPTSQPTRPRLPNAPRRTPSCRPGTHVDRLESMPRQRWQPA
jgi:hypothetical protein